MENNKPKLETYTGTSQCYGVHAGYMCKQPEFITIQANKMSHPAWIQALWVTLKKKYQRFNCIQQHLEYKK